MTRQPTTTSPSARWTRPPSPRRSECLCPSLRPKVGEGKTVVFSFLFLNPQSMSLWGARFKLSQFFMTHWRHLLSQAENRILIRATVIRPLEGGEWLKLPERLHAVPEGTRFPSSGSISKSRDVSAIASTAGSITTFSGEANLCPRCNKKVYFGEWRRPTDGGGGQRVAGD